MIIVFDLDDTLYDELTFVHSGFRAISQFLNAHYSLPVEESYERMITALALGRGRIFDEVLGAYGIYSKRLVRQCLSVYRTHRPNIFLSCEADACLQRFADYPIYIVTDGNKLVQYNKVKALGLVGRVKDFFITHRHGVKYAKPSPYCFLKICEREKVLPNQVVYIADNIRKDFVGIKPLGFRTVRIMQGQYQHVIMSEEYEAECKIQSLAALDEMLLDNLFERRRPQ